MTRSPSRRAVLAAAATPLLPGSTVAMTAAPSSRPPTSQPADLGFDPGRLAALDAYFERLVSGGEAVGATSLVLRHGRVAHAGCWGLADRQAKTLMAWDTIFRMYSQTKPVTAVAMMILHEAGAWRLEDKLADHIPEFRGLRVLVSTQPEGTFVTEPAPHEPTLLDLMTYTAGFTYGLNPDDPMTPAYQSRHVLGAPSLQAMIDALAGLPLAYPPGTQWRYGVSADIQGYLVEKLSGQSLPKFMAQRIFEPLRMSDTGFHLPAAKVGRLAALYQQDAQGGPPADFPAQYLGDPTQPPAAPSGGAGLFSTASDYARFCQMLLNGGELDGVRVLSPASVQALRSDHLLAGTPLSTVGTPVPLVTRGMGFGFNVAVVTDPALAGTPVGAGTYFWGGAAGTWFWIDPQNDLVALGLMHVIRYPDNLRMGNAARTALYGALRS